MGYSLRFWTVSWSLVVLLVSSEFAVAKSPDANSEAIDLFAAMDSGVLEVKLFLKDASAGTVLLKNRSNKPLSIKLPDAFGGMPVAAQFFGPMPGGGGLGIGANGGGGGNPLFGGGGNQNVGAGFPPAVGNNNRNGGGLLGPGFFNIEPGKERKLKVAAVCLQHGKDEPNPRVAYRICPIASVTEKPEVAELLKSLANDATDQRAVQAAAWHLENGLSWKELAKMPRIRHLGGVTERFFSALEIDRARAYSDASLVAAKQRKPPGYVSTGATPAPSK
jgi:hypothetical protein